MTIQIPRLQQPLRMQMVSTYSLICQMEITLSALAICHKVLSSLQVEMEQTQQTLTLIQVQV